MPLSVMIQSLLFGAHSLFHEGGSNSSYPMCLQRVPSTVKATWARCGVEANERLQGEAGE